MKKIISIKDAAQISKESKVLGKKIVLTGGCFDILHAGHIKFLDEAKKSADLLILLLESDENIKKNKGKGRPVNSQKNRSIVLSAITSVDYILPLEGVTKDQDYDKLIVQIRPDYIALTLGDVNKLQRQKQCEKVGAKLVEVERVKGVSSSNYINNIE